MTRKNRPTPPAPSSRPVDMGVTCADCDTERAANVDGCPKCGSSTIDGPEAGRLWLSSRREG